MDITAIIINGRHGGRVLNMEYMPTVKIPVDNENQISIGEEHDHSVRMGSDIEYKECFRSVDKKCVLYSTSGRWDDIKQNAGRLVGETYPIRLW